MDKTGTRAILHPEPVHCHYQAPPMRWDGTLLPVFTGGGQLDLG